MKSKSIFAIVALVCGLIAVIYVMRRGGGEELSSESLSTRPKLSPPAPAPSLELDCGDGVTMRLTLIPAGEFRMGSPENEEGRHNDEGPQHVVRITKPFYMGTHEVTVGEFKKFVAATGYRTEAEHRGDPKWTFTWRNPGFVQDDSHPVACVSWNDAQEFCRWLRCRLPTEAEWEYACRAGTYTWFSFGDNDENFDSYAWHNSNSGNKTHPVGTKNPNAWGLYDMHGNAWEWCADWYGKDYYNQSPTNDPIGPVSGKERVVRGGAWLADPSLCRSADRDMLDPTACAGINGFRVVRGIE